ncbi:protein furry homolog-like isoform X15 [Babesia caballi]|uniref:Protein furry homolog-like isoform X15 n=1 Tax=Babesia caballi TaxID=5871 RepID=A0AAV4LM05_BABCB|nr:protein furry homolog-like isoform X15 [Babesia caballi]
MRLPALLVKFDQAVDHGAHLPDVAFVSGEKNLGHVEVASPMRHKLGQQPHGAARVHALRNGADGWRGLVEARGSHLALRVEGGGHSGRGSRTEELRTATRWCRASPEAGRSTGIEGRRAGGAEDRASRPSGCPGRGVETERHRHSPLYNCPAPM